MFGKTISHYQILGKLGEGGMGVVYKARDTSLDRFVALKFLHSSEDTPRLLREAKTGASFNHPNICAVHEVDPERGFIAMELVEGQSLAARIGARPLPVAEAVDLAVQICKGLKAAHDKGITHRDIKSGNVLVTADGHAKILDFGLARVAGQAGLTREGAVAGTPGYMAPEQMHGEPADRRTDIWATGAVLYEMLTGRPPLGQADTLPEGLGRVVRKALAAEPSDRYQYIEDMIVDLMALRAGSPQVSRVSEAWPRRREFLWAAAGVTGAAAFAVGLDLGGIRSRAAGLFARSASIRSIAVLPIQNLSGDPNQEYFADGMTDALITDISKIGALKVISRTSVMQYKGARKSLPAIARDLNVDAVVEGSVVREAGRVRVTAQLIEASTDRHLWAESYEREVTGILTLQRDVARAVARGVRVKLRPEEEARLDPGARQVNPATYEAYLKGMFFLNKATPDDIAKGMSFFHEAVEKDPADPLAYAGLAMGYIEIAHGADPAPDSLQKASAAARTALKLDATQAETLTSMGFIEGYYEWKWDEAMRDIQRALDINPSTANAYFHLAWFHSLFGRMKEAIEAHKRAQELDPFNPANTVWLGELYRWERRYPEAMTEVLKALKMAPDFPMNHFVLGLIYEDQGKYDKEIAAFQKAATADPSWRWALGPAYVAAGRRNEARKVLTELNKQKLLPWNVWWRMLTNASLGDNDEAFRWLNYDHQHAWAPWVRVWLPRHLSGLRKDPRFPAVLRRMNLPPIS